MALTSIPPQAYTQETLKKAFSWLQTQPEDVRKVATTPDSLVTIFLKAQRYNDLLNQPTAATQGFKNELRNLADEMRQFESAEQAPEVRKPVPPVRNREQELKTLLDPGTLAILSAVKNGLNLSDETEALRMMVRLGFEKIRPILPAD